MNVVLGYPDGHWNEWTSFSQAFLDEILTKGALPVRDADGTYYDMAWRADGVLTLDGCTAPEVFTNTCAGGVSTVDDRMVQLYSGGKLVANLSAAQAFAYAPTSTWELWKAYYENAGFTTGRTGTWTAPSGTTGDGTGTGTGTGDGTGDGTTTVTPVSNSTLILGAIVLGVLLLKR